MSKNEKIPDAWDDDYEAIADSKPPTAGTAEPMAPAKLSRAERKAQHAAANKQLWESAENPETQYFVEARDNVPLKSDFKPAVKVLSRKPKPATTTSATGLESSVGAMKLENDEYDSEEEERKAQARDLAERQERSRLEREEKQRRYEEVRERLFGSSANNESSNKGRSSPTRGSSSGRGRGQRGARRGRDGKDGSRPSSSSDMSPVRGPSQTQQLFDPSYTPKPGSVFLETRNNSSAPPENQPIRTPRGPDGNGKGFRPRGNRPTAT